MTSRFLTRPVLAIVLTLLIVPTAIASAILGFPLTFSVPHLAGLNFDGGTVVLPELMALIVALATYTASFIAEIVRAGIQGVAKGQTEAAQALGLPRGQTLRLVIVPQAMRQIIAGQNHVGHTHHHPVEQVHRQPDRARSPQSRFASARECRSGQYWRRPGRPSR